MKTVTKTLLAAISALSLFTGCGTITGTVTPDEVEVRDGSGNYDATVPSPYDPGRSGFCTYTRDEKGKITGAVISSGAKARYNALVATYAIQFKTFRKVELGQDDGVKPFVDSYKNSLFWIDRQHLGYFSELARWSRNKRDPDSVWMKIKEKIL